MVFILLYLFYLKNKFLSDDRQYLTLFDKCTKKNTTAVKFYSKFSANAKVLGLFPLANSDNLFFFYYFWDSGHMGSGQRFSLYMYAA